MKSIHPISETNTGNGSWLTFLVVAAVLGVKQNKTQKLKVSQIKNKYSPKDQYQV